MRNMKAAIGTLILWLAALSGAPVAFAQTTYQPQGFPPPGPAVQQVGGQDLQGNQYFGKNVTAEQTLYTNNLVVGMAPGTAAAPTGSPSYTTVPGYSAGTITSGTYYAKCVAFDWYGGYTLPSVEGSATLSATGSITWTCAAIANAAYYQIWVGSSAGTEAAYFTTQSNSNVGVQVVPIASLISGTINSVANTGYIFGSSQTVALTGADWSCGTGGITTSCVTAGTIGAGAAAGQAFTFALPPVARTWTLECEGVVGQATGATANTWYIQTASNGATNFTAWYNMATAATAFAAGAVTDTASTTTATAIAPAWTLGGTGTKMPFHIGATIEGASTSGTVVNIQLAAPTVADLVTIYRGAECHVY